MFKKNQGFLILLNLEKIFTNVNLKLKVDHQAILKKKFRYLTFKTLASATVSYQQIVPIFFLFLSMAKEIKLRLS